MGSLKGYTNHIVRNFVFCGFTYGLYETYKLNINTY